MNNEHCQINKNLYKFAQSLLHFHGYALYNTKFAQHLRSNGSEAHVILAFQASLESQNVDSRG